MMLIKFLYGVLFRVKSDAELRDISGGKCESKL